MSDECEHSKLPATPSSTAYEVGYRKPPTQTRFKPGRSGNPDGRRKRAKTSSPHGNKERMKALILEEAYRTITVRDGNRAVRMPVIQAVMRSTGLSAAKGNQRSQRLFTELVRLVEGENQADHDRMLQTVIEYKSEWEDKLEMRRHLGIIAPDPVPHPDDIEIDFRNGTVRLKGPLTKDQKPLWDKLRALKQDADKELMYLDKLLTEQPDDDSIREEIVRCRRIRDRISVFIPD